jgi:hypothetical protein
VLPGNYPIYPIIGVASFAHLMGATLQASVAR